MDGLKEVLVAAALASICAKVRAANASTVNCARRECALRPDCFICSPSTTNLGRSQLDPTARVVAPRRNVRCADVSTYRSNTAQLERGWDTSLRDRFGIAVTPELVSRSCGRRAFKLSLVADVANRRHVGQVCTVLSVLA